jgi:hypothetical protein
MFASWPFYRGFFSRRLETADPAVLVDDAAHTEPPHYPGEPNTP